MSATLNGGVKLQEPYEDDFIRISCASLGHVHVSGEFIEHPYNQAMTFEFETDQTCLVPFICDLENIIKMTEPTAAEDAQEAPRP